jgi:hypothetical protein
LHQGGAQGTSTHVTENAVRFTEKLKTEIRNTYSMKTNILGPTACAMAMQIDLTDQQNKSKGHGHPSHGGAGIPPKYKKKSRKLWARHLSWCSCSMAKVSAIHVHLTIFDLLTNRRATRGMLKHRQCRRWGTPAIGIWTRPTTSPGNGRGNHGLKQEEAPDRKSAQMPDTATGPNKTHAVD